MADEVLKANGMSACCLKGFVHAGAPKGTMETLGGLPCYIASPPPSAKRAPTILMVADVFGPKFVNSQLLADTYAAAGFHVLLPDVYGGKALPANAIEGVFSALWCLPTIVGFFSSTGAAITTPRVQAAAAAARTRAVDVGNGKLGSIGFCYGGPYSMSLASGTPAVDAYAVAHGGGVTKELIFAGKVPGLIIVPEHETMALTPKQAAEAKAGLPAGMQVEFNEYKGQKHGFTTRGGPETDDMRAKAAADVVAFFRRTL
jgi:dienelactone hydrolase